MTFGLRSWATVSSRGVTGFPVRPLVVERDQLNDLLLPSKALALNTVALFW